MDELLEAVMIDSDYRALDSRFRLMRGADLLELCRSLVVHRDETDIITLSHMSVKEYLVGKLIIDELRWYHIVMEDAHERLARLCMAYIAICLEQVRDRSSSVTREQHIILTTLQESLPLLEYVLSYGLSHLSHLGPENSGIFKDIEGLQVRIHRHDWEWDQLCRFVPLVRSGIPWPTSEHDVPLYILVAFGSGALFRAFVRRATLTPREGTNPLVYAAYFGKIEHARILISWGVDINLRGFILDAMVTNHSDADTVDVDESDEDGSNSDKSDVGDAIDHKAIPLEVAVDRWQAEIVDLLLAHASIVPARLLARVLGEQPHKFPLYIINRLLQRSEFAKWSVNPWENRGLLDVLISDAEDRGQVDGRDEVALALRRLVEVGCAEILLLVAVEKGCISVVEALLSMNTPSLDLSLAPHSHAIMNALAANGDTPLHLALQLSDENHCLLITKLLVEAGFSPSELDAGYKPPVHIAVMRGFISVVEYLLSQDVPLPSRILFSALQAPPPKRVKMIRLLISKRANVHVLSPGRDSLLRVATGSLDRSVGMEVAQILIDAGCIPPAFNLDGNTLNIVAEQEYREVGSYLLLSGTSLDIFSLLDPDPSTQAAALHWLISNVHGLRLRPEEEDRLLQVVSQCLDDEDQYLALAKKVLTAQGDLCSGGTSLFDGAVRRGFRRVIEYLDSQRVPIPRTILFTALRHQLSMVPFLIRKGADLHAKENNGYTLLHVAMSTLEETQCHMTVQTLVDAGCHFSVPNDANQISIDIAISRGFVSVVEYLLSQPMPLPHRFLFTALRHQVSMVPLLLRTGADVHVRENNGDTVLHVAMSISEESQCHMVVQALVQAGCSTSTSNTAGVRPIHVAVSRGFISIVKYLLSFAPRDGLPPDLLSSVLSLGRDDDFPFIRRLSFWYSKSQSLDVAKLLVEAGCSTSVPNTDGELPIQIAVAMSMVPVVEYLLSQNAPFPRGILLTAMKAQCNYFASGAFRMISLLVRNGADVSVCATNGDSVLHLALLAACEGYRSLSYELLGVVTILVQGGCDPCARNSRGQTPLEVAAIMEYDKVVDYLRTFDPSLWALSHLLPAQGSINCTTSYDRYDFLS
ncbi:ankyrin [Imleria badia]|nr:ankyrin [Imleria badia]